MPTRGRSARPPANPAPVTSNPGALSGRSDGGPAANLAYNAESHGDRQDFQAHQAAGGSSSPPGATGGQGGPPLPSGPPAGGPPGAPVELMDVFGPSSNPGVSPASTSAKATAIPDDPDMMLRVMYANFPHPDLLRLLQKRTGL